MYFYRLIEQYKTNDVDIHSMTCDFGWVSFKTVFWFGLYVAHHMYITIIKGLLATIVHNGTQEY